LWKASPFYSILSGPAGGAPYRPTNIVNYISAGQSGASFAAVFGLPFMFNPLFPVSVVAATLPGLLNLKIQLFCPGQ